MEEPAVAGEREMEVEAAAAGAGAVVAEMGAAERMSKRHRIGPSGTKAERRRQRSCRSTIGCTGLSKGR